MTPATYQRIGIGFILLLSVCAIGGCIRRSKDPNFRPFRIALPTGELAVSYDYDRTTRQRNNQSKSKDIDAIIREEATMSTHGSIYHPKLFSFDLNGTLALAQGQQQTDTFNDKSRSRLQGLGFIGTVLKDHMTSGDLFITVRSDQVNRDFAEDLYNDLRRLGARLKSRNEFLPMTIKVEESVLKTETSSENFKTTERTLSVNAAHQVVGSETDLNYYVTETEETRDNRTFITQEFNLGNHLLLDSDHSGSLRSNLRLFDQSGDVQFRNMDINEQLNWQVTKDLASDSRYRFDLRQTDSERTDRHTVGTGLQHKLYNSLRTSLHMEGYTEEVTDQAGDADGTSRRIQSDLTLQYAKIIPWGRFTADAGYRYDHNDDNFNSSQRTTSDESVTLTDGIITLLKNTEVKPTSVVVTNVTGTTFYVVGSDYLLVQLGDRTEIRRIITGFITNGQTVLVDYSFIANPTLTYASTTQNVGTAISLFDLVQPYVRVSKKTQDLIDGKASTRLEELDRMVYGIDVWYGGFRLKQEYEDHDSSTLPYTATTTNATFQAPVSERAVLSMTASRRDTLFSKSESSPTDSRSTLISFGSKLKTRVAENGWLELSGGWRRDTRSDFQSTRFDLGTQLQWRWGALTLTTGMTLENEEEELIDREQTTFFFKLTRRF